MIAITPMTRLTPTARPLPVALWAEGSISLQSGLDRAMRIENVAGNLRCVGVECAIEDISMTCEPPIQILVEDKLTIQR